MHLPQVTFTRIAVTNDGNRFSVDTSPHSQTATSTNISMQNLTIAITFQRLGYVEYDRRNLNRFLNHLGKVPYASSFFFTVLLSQLPFIFFLGWCTARPERALESIRWRGSTRCRWRRSLPGCASKLCHRIELTRFFIYIYFCKVESHVRDRNFDNAGQSPLSMCLAYFLHTKVTIAIDCHHSFVHYYQSCFSLLRFISPLLLATVHWFGESHGEITTCTNST